MNSNIKRMYFRDLFLSKYCNIVQSYINVTSLANNNEKVLYKINNKLFRYY